jgi:hypothetical protein
MGRHSSVHQSLDAHYDEEMSLHVRQDCKDTDREKEQVLAESRFDPYREHDHRLLVRRLWDRRWSFPSDQAHFCSST